MRAAARSLRRLPLLAACLAATALVALPALHGAHAPLLAHANTVAASPLPAIDAHAHADAKGCALCAAVGQARTALTGAAVALPSDSLSARRVEPARIAAPPTLAQAAPAAPRAPPVRI